jgi:hypothetical protein
MCLLLAAVAIVDDLPATMYESFEAVANAHPKRESTTDH